MKKLLLSILASAVLVMLAVPASAQDAKNGQKLFKDYTCYGCHGYSGQNGPGNRLVPMRMPKEALIAYVRNPPNPNRMPSYSAKVLSDEQLGDIWAYVRTLKDAPPASDIKLLQDIKAELGQ